MSITDVILDPFKENLNLSSLYAYFHSVAQNPHAQSVLMASPWQHTRVPPV